MRSIDGKNPAPPIITINPWNLTVLSPNQSFSSKLYVPFTIATHFKHWMFVFYEDRSPLIGLVISGDELGVYGNPEEPMENLFFRISQFGQTREELANYTGCLNQLEQPHFVGLNKQVESVTLALHNSKVVFLAAVSV